jgi:hypothetical protein
MRRSALGRNFESSDMVAVLESMKVRGRITRYVRNDPNSVADSNGKDFTVWVDEVEKSFGVTISRTSWNVSRRRYRDVAQFLFPIGTSSETIEERILSLFR